MKFEEHFQNYRVLLPVIHVANQNQALRNSKIAFEEGADGIFLINHFDDCENLFEIYDKIRNFFPDKWIGINCLDYSPLQMMEEILPDINGLWVDNTYIDETSENQTYPEKVYDIAKQRNWKGLYFGGVDFKYQPKVNDLETAVNISKKYMDIITTSGKGTGVAADLDKIIKIREFAKDFPVAVASGINSQNIKNYLPYVNCFLVATGISKSFTELDNNKLNELIKIIRAYNYYN